MSTFLGRDETFWVGVQALIAASALLGLIAYVIDTARMRRGQDRTIRASVTPVLTFQRLFIRDQYSGMSKKPDWVATVILRNVGEGAALFLTGWYQQVSDQFGWESTEFLLRSAVTSDATCNAYNILKGEEVSFYLNLSVPTARWLFVAECTDPRSGMHQMQMIFSGETVSQAQMTHRSGDTWGEWIVSVLQRYAQVIKTLERASRDITGKD